MWLMKKLHVKCIIKKKRSLKCKILVEKLTWAMNFDRILVFQVFYLK